MRITLLEIEAALAHLDTFITTTFVTHLAKIKTLFDHTHLCLKLRQAKTAPKPQHTFLKKEKHNKNNIL